MYLNYYRSKSASVEEAATSPHFFLKFCDYDQRSRHIWPHWVFGYLADAHRQRLDELLASYPTNLSFH